MSVVTPVGVDGYAPPPAVPYDDETRRRWEADLWATLEVARDAWVSSSAAGGNPRDIAIARVLVAICTDHERGRSDAIGDLSEWARGCLHPTQVVFSPHVRGAKVREVLDQLVLALHGDPRTNPAARILGGRTVATSSTAGGPTGRDRRPERARLHYRLDSQPSHDEVWGEAVPVTMVIYGTTLLPPDRREADAETAAFIADHLEHARAVLPLESRAQALRAALGAIRERLHAAGVLAPSENHAQLAVVAVEVERPKIETLDAEDDNSRERSQARAVLSTVLRAWGLDGDEVDEYLRFDRKSSAPTPPRDQRPTTLHWVLPLEESNASARALRGAWNAWHPTAPELGDDQLLRVRAVLDALMQAWNSNDEDAIVGGGAVALRRLKPQHERHFLLAPTDKAKVMKGVVALELRMFAREVLDARVVRKVIEAHVETRGEGVVRTLTSLVGELFPWWTQRSTAQRAALADVVARGLANDARALCDAAKRSASDDRLRSLVEGLADKRAEKLVREALRQAGMDSKAANNLFPGRG